MPYVAYSHVFPYAEVIVHQGGSGTTGEALRAGRPMLIVPYGWDQPDNAARIERLGAGRHISRRNYTVESAVASLRSILDQAQLSTRAAELGRRVSAENGLNGACDAVESLIQRVELRHVARDSAR